MKIGILTQPLHNNYGGLLQAYALKEVLQSLQHEVLIINRQSPQWRKYASIIKSILLGRKIAPNILLKQSDKDVISKNTIEFREKYIPNLTRLFTDNKSMADLNNMGFDAYMVGSDQCWRPRYSPAIQNYFLDFAENEKKVKRIAYAASFGVSNWEFTNKNTERSKELLKKFDAISVREDSAINLIKNKLEREDAIQVIDPTMLLSSNQYKDIVKAEKTPSSPGNLKVYVLDKTKEKDSFIHQIQESLQLKVFEVMPRKRVKDEKVTNNTINDFIYPSPAAWLRGFQDARFVITDSFHGTVFSIIFNKPFITIGNKDRGLSRFTALLKSLKLENRLICEPSELTDQLILAPIDFKTVNQLIQMQQEKALNFLYNNLS